MTLSISGLYQKLAADFPQVERYQGFTEKPVSKIQNHTPEAKVQEFQGLRASSELDPTQRSPDIRYITDSYRVQGTDRYGTVDARSQLDETWSSMLDTFSGMIVDENELIHRKSRSSGAMKTAFGGGNGGGGYNSSGQPSTGTMPVAFAGNERGIKTTDSVGDALNVMRDAAEQQSRMYSLLHRTSIVQGVTKSIQKVVDNLSRGS